MKKTLVSLSLISLTFSLGSVYASTNKDDIRIPDTPAISLVVANSERQEKIASTTLVRLKAKGVKLVDERIAALNKNEKAITNSDLTTDQKAALTGKISVNITGLTTLKTNINAGINATSTRSLIDSVYTNFRIYGIVIPQIRLEKRIYDLQNHISKLNSAFTQIQIKINEAKTLGRDTTAWQKNLDDAKVLVNADSNKLTALLTETRSLTPANYGTSSKATIESVNSGIKTIVKDLYGIEKTAKKLKNIKITASSTASIR